MELDVLSTGNVFDYKYSPKFSYFAVAVARGVYLYPVEELYRGNIESGDFIDLFNEMVFSTPGENPFVFAFSPDEKNIALGFGSGMIKILDLKSRQYILELQAYSGSVRSIAYSPDGQYIASSGDKAVTLWNPETSARIRSQMVGKDQDVMHFSYDGSWLITANDDNSSEILIWRTETLTIRKTISALTVPDSRYGKVSTRPFVNNIAISPDQNLVAIKAGSGQVRSSVEIWDLDNMKLINSASSVIMPGLSFLSGDIALVGCGQNICKTNVRTFDMEILINDDGKIGYVHGGKKILINPNSMVMSFPDYRELYNNYYFFDYSNGKLLFKFSPEFSSMIVNRLSDSGAISQKIILNNLGQEYIVSTTNVAVEKLISEIYKDQSYDTSAISHDGSILAIGNHDGTINIWDVQNKILLRTITAHRPVRGWLLHGIDKLQFSPDDLTLVSVGYDQQLKVWDIQTGETIAQTDVSRSGTRAPIIFLEDGSHFFLPSDSVEIKMFSAETYQSVATVGRIDRLTPRGVYNRIWAMSLSPDGNYIIYSDTSGNLFFWDLNEQKLEKSIRFPDVVSNVTFSDNGAYMIITFDGGSISVWGAPTP